MSNNTQNTNFSQEKKSLSWLPILTSGLFIGLCIGLMTFIGLAPNSRDTIKTHYYLAVNAYYAGCIQASGTRTQISKTKKYCQDATDFYANELRVITGDIK